MWTKMDNIFSRGTVQLLTALLFCSFIVASEVDVADNSELGKVSGKNESDASSNGVRTADKASSESVNKSNSTEDGLPDPFIPFLPKRETDKVTSTTLSGGMTEKLTTTTTTTKPPTTEETTTITTSAATTAAQKVDATTIDTKSDTTTVTNMPPTTIHQHKTDKSTSISKINQVTTTVQKTSTLKSTINLTSTRSSLMTTKSQQEILKTSTDAKTPDSMTTKSSTSKQTTKVPTTLKNTHESVSMTTGIIKKSTSKPMTQNTDKQTILPTEFKDPVTARSLDNSTIEQSNSTTEDPMRIVVIYSEDDFTSRDSFWPIALALTVGIPSIIVMAVTITVLYRRRTANPRSRLSIYAGHDYSTM